MMLVVVVFVGMRTQTVFQGGVSGEVDQEEDYDDREHGPL
jgi:hypothetical protein